MFNKLVHIKLFNVIRGALHRFSGRRAAVALIIALSAPLLIATTGLSVDIGYWYQQQTALQSAADAAALAAATSDYNYLSTQPTTANGTVSSTTAQAAGTTAADGATSSQFKFASQSANLNVVPASACPTGASCTAPAGSPTPGTQYTTGMQYMATVSAPRTSFFSNVQGMGLTGMFGGSLYASATAVVSANISVTGDSCLLANPKNGNNTGIEITDNGGGSKGGISGSDCAITVNCPDGTAFQAPNSANASISAQNIVVAGKCTGGVGYSGNLYTTADANTATAAGPNGVQTVANAAPDPLASMGDALGDAYAAGVSGATEATWQSDCGTPTEETPITISGTTVGYCEPPNTGTTVFNSTAPSVPYFFPQGLNVGNSNITFGPGIYYFGGELNATGNGSITGTGVTLVFVGKAYFNLTGSNAMGNLSAPDSSTNPKCVPPAQYPDGSIDGTHGNGICGVLIYQGRDDSAGDSLAGNTASTVNGIIYTPDTQLTFSGNGAFNAGKDPNGSLGTLAVLASSIFLNGNGKLTLNINANDDAGALLSKPISTVGNPTPPLLIQ